MITLLIGLTILIFVLAIGLLIAGVIAISPLLLILLALPFLDFFMIRTIFKKKEKKE